MTKEPPLIVKKKIDDYLILEYKNSKIYVVENILDEDLCKKIIKIIDTIPKIKDDWKPGNNVKCFFRPLNDLLNVDDTDFYPVYTEDVDLHKINEKIKNKEKITTTLLNGVKRCEIKCLTEKLEEKFSAVDKIFCSLFKDKNISFKNKCGIHLRKIYGETREHQDGECPQIKNKTSLQFIEEQNVHNYRIHKKERPQKNKVNIRVLTTVFALNDDHNGGEFCFPEYDIKVKLNRGSMICFPPYWTHTHKTESLMNNTFRYTLNTWIYKEENAH